MTKRVEPALADAGIDTQPVEVSRQVARVDGCSDRRREHVAFAAPGLAGLQLRGCLRASVRAERLEAGSLQREGTSRSCRLGSGFHQPVSDSPREGGRNRQRASFHVDVRPAQRERLALA